MPAQPKPKRMPRAVLLDLDDTILDDSSAVDRCWRDACAAHCGGLADVDTLYAAVRRKGECNGFKRPKKSNIGQGADEWTNDGVLDVDPGSNKDTAAPRIVPRAIARPMSASRLAPCS